MFITDVQGVLTSRGSILSQSIGHLIPLLLQLISSATTPVPSPNERDFPGHSTLGLLFFLGDTSRVRTRTSRSQPISPV